VADTPDQVLALTVSIAQRLGYRVLLDCQHGGVTHRYVELNPKWILVERGLTRLAQARRIAAVLAQDPRTDTSLLPDRERELVGLAFTGGSRISHGG
jgi:hypothetical protein